MSRIYTVSFSGTVTSAGGDTDLFEIPSLPQTLHIDTSTRPGCQYHWRKSGAVAGAAF
jgi:hypothetical protein